MKLKCPSCASEYRVDASAIGRRGRMVRCANCGAEWFQAPGEDEPAAAPAEPQALAAPEPQAAPQIEPPVEQPIPGYRIEPYEEAAPEPVSAVPAEVERIYYDYEPEPEPETAEEAAPVEETRMRRRREEERDELAASLADINHAPPARTGGAFLAGFSTVALAAVVGLGVYVKAEDIAVLAPAAGPVLDQFTALVDQGRVALAGLVG